MRAMANVVAACLAVTGPVASANGATLLGSYVTASYHYPFLGFPQAQSGPILVDENTEFPNGSLGTAAAINVTDTQILFVSFSNTFYTSEEFNGFVLKFSDAAPITDAAISTSNLGRLPKITFTADSVMIDMSDVQTSPGSFFFVDIGAGAVPEPVTWAMMIVGFGVAGASVRRLRQKTCTLV